jgi:hypothetical protein
MCHGDAVAANTTRRGSSNAVQVDGRDETGWSYRRVGQRCIVGSRELGTGGWAAEVILIRGQDDEILSDGDGIPK